MEPRPSTLPAQVPPALPSDETLLNPPTEGEQESIPPSYIPHATHHEVTGNDPVRPSLQNNGTPVARFKTLNFVGFTLAEDATNNRVTISGGVQRVSVATATWDPPSLPTLTSGTTTVAVSGAVLGDFILVSFSTALLAGMILSGFVSSAGVVTVTLANIRADTVDIGSGTLTIWVLR